MNVFLRPFWGYTSRLVYPGFRICYTRAYLLSPYRGEVKQQFLMGPKQHYYLELESELELNHIFLIKASIEKAPGPKAKMINAVRRKLNGPSATKASGFSKILRTDSI